MLRVPAHLTFEQLHEVLQVAFGWTNSHAYSFEAHTIANKPAKRDRWGPDPTHIMTLEMGDTAGYVADMLGPEGAAHIKACRAVKLRDVLEQPEWRALGVALTYQYDFGDRWEHHIKFLGPAEPHLSTALGLKSVEAEQKVFCFGGEGHPCCEDCGSYGGFEELKDLFRNPEKPDPYKRRVWYRRHAANGNPRGLDPWKWDIVKTNKELKKLMF